MNQMGMNSTARELLLALLRNADAGKRGVLSVQRKPHYRSTVDLGAREAIHATLANAKAAGAVELEWGRGAASQDLLRLRLVDADRLASFLGVVRSADAAASITSMIEGELAGSPPWLRAAFHGAVKAWTLGQKAYRVAAEEPEKAMEIFHLAAAVASGNHQGLDMRTFSIRTLGDAKAVERLRGPFCSLLRQDPELAHIEADDHLLRAIGLEKFPPPVHLSGPLTVHYRSQVLDLTPFKPYLAFSPDEISSITLPRPPSYVLAIENLASFQRYVREIDDDGVVVYTAGFASPALVQLLARLDTVLPALTPVWHWGDRDVGGLRILRCLEPVFATHELKPHLMSGPLPSAKPFSPVERRALIRLREGRDQAAELAAGWLAQGHGRLEQEAVDPQPPQQAR